MAENHTSFPYDNSKERLARYKFNDQLFEGDHWDAFNEKISSEQFNKQYSQLKYVTSNFAGLISKVCADMLFSEPVGIDVEDDQTQAFVDGLIFQNKLHTQNYESALANSRHGDAIFKLRVGKMNEADEQSTVIIEDITPSIYFPVLNKYNSRQEPEEKELCWKVKIGDKEYLRKEIHYSGYIENKVYLLEGTEIKNQEPLDILGADAPPSEYEETGIKKSLIVHIPNWRDSSRYFGYDDYYDLTSLFYAINNRMTKTENILDKHSDPILALPEGVLDEHGKVKKESFSMFEIPTEGTGTPAKPEYIVWNASLESNFKHIEKMVEFLYMFSETSPSAFGMDKGGVAESGRALKLRLMRTIAKVGRKRLYYDNALKQVVHTAQLLAQAHNVGVYNKKTDKYDIKVKTAEIPSLIWADGLPQDNVEAVEIEEKRLGMGNTTVADSIQRLEGIDKDKAEDKAKDIKDENKIDVPTTVPNMATMIKEDIDVAGA